MPATRAGVRCKDEGNSCGRVRARFEGTPEVTSEAELARHVRQEASRPPAGSQGPQTTYGRAGSAGEGCASAAQKCMTSPGVYVWGEPPTRKLPSSKPGAWRTDMLKILELMDRTARLQGALSGLQSAPGGLRAGASAGRAASSRLFGILGWRGPTPGGLQPRSSGAPGPASTGQHALLQQCLQQDPERAARRARSIVPRPHGGHRVRPAPCNPQGPAAAAARDCSAGAGRRQVMQPALPANRLADVALGLYRVRAGLLARGCPRSLHCLARPVHMPGADQWHGGGRSWRW